MFKEEREELQFDWKMIGDIGEGRPNLGPGMSVAVYRLLAAAVHKGSVPEAAVHKDLDIRLVLPAVRKDLGIRYLADHHNNRYTEQTKLLNILLKQKVLIKFFL